MNVLLTGHNGYVGSVLSGKLIEAGHEVTGLDTNFFAGCTLGKTNLIPEIKKDIRNVTSVDLRGFDAIIHLAALSNDPMGDINSSLTYDINLYATLRLAEIARLSDVKRFIYASSCSIYGAGDGDEILNEDSPIAPISHYAMSKAFAEEGLARLGNKNFTPVFLRNATVYGYSPRMRTDLVLNTMTLSAYTTGKIQVMGDGMLWRPIVHVEDVAQAFVLALEAPRDIVYNRSFNVGFENYRVKELAEIVKGVVSDSEIEYVDGGKDSRSYRVDFSKISKELGFAPKWNARQGAEQLLSVFREHTKFGDKYVRLKWLKYLMDVGFVNRELYWRMNGRG